jgi:hypothetical protein
VVEQLGQLDDLAVDSADGECGLGESGSVVFAVQYQPVGQPGHLGMILCPVLRKGLGL